MNTNEKLIDTFYRSFAAGDAESMVSCYHQDVVFTDPAFGRLEGDRARAMWRMLLTSKTTELSVKYYDIAADEKNGRAEWTANYLFGPNKRPVENNVIAQFTFSEGKILHHTDDFDTWKWSRQALGIGGAMLGWTGFMKSKIQKTTNARLKAFMSKSKM